MNYIDEEYCWFVFQFKNPVFCFFFFICELQDESGNLIYRDDKPLIHTDGTGFISEDLALLCPNNISKGKRISNQKIKVCHFIFQS